MPSPKLASGPVKHDKTPYDTLPEAASAFALKPTVKPVPTTVVNASAVVMARTEIVLFRFLTSSPLV